MGIVTQYHKDTDTTYVYESESYYDPSKKQSRSKRKLIGKLDKETGEIIPTGKRGPKKKDKLESSGEGNLKESRQDEEKIQKLEEENHLLQCRIIELTEKNQKLSQAVTEAEHLKRENQRLSGILEKIRAAMM